MSLYVFWLQKGPLVKYVCNWWGDGKGDPNAYKCVQGEGDVTSHVYVHTYTKSFHVFGKIFVL